MMALLKKIVFKPIGYVETNTADNNIKDKSLISKIVIRNDLAGGLEGLSCFSHLFVLFYLNKVSHTQRKILKVHPRGKIDLPLTGVFAVRTMFRPNPIGLTLVELLKVENNVLTIKGLDAYNGTPVLDLKPYDSWDTVQKIKVPEWWTKLNEGNAKPKIIL